MPSICSVRPRGKHFPIQLSSFQLGGVAKCILTLSQNGMDLLSNCPLPNLPCSVRQRIARLHRKGLVYLPFFHSKLAVFFTFQLPSAFCRESNCPPHPLHQKEILFLHLLTFTFSIFPAPPSTAANQLPGTRRSVSHRSSVASLYLPNTSLLI